MLRRGSEMLADFRLHTVKCLSFRQFRQLLFLFFFLLISGDFKGTLKGIFKRLPPVMRDRLPGNSKCVSVTGKVRLDRFIQMLLPDRI